MRSIWLTTGEKRIIFYQSKEFPCKHLGLQIVSADLELVI
jgi:hypothetical protein